MNNNYFLRKFNYYSRLACFDCKRMTKDMLLVMLCLSIVSTAVIFFMLPHLIKTYPILAEYKQILIIDLALNNALLIGACSAFMYIEDKVDDILFSYQVTQLGMRGYQMYRCVTTLVGAFLFSFCTLYLFNLYLQVTNSLLLTGSFLIASSVFLFHFLISKLSKSKLEAFVFFKLSVFLIQLPLVVYFSYLDAIRSSKVIFLIYFLPSYWATELFLNHAANEVFIYFSFSFVFVMWFLIIYYYDYKFRGN